MAIKTYMMRVVTATILTATIPAVFSTLMFSQNRTIENGYYKEKDVEIFNNYLSFIKEIPLKR